MSNAGNAPFGTREPQPFLPPEAQPYPQNQPHVPRPHQQQGGGHDGGGQQDRQQGDRQPHVDRLPSFITGGQQPAARKLSRRSRRVSTISRAPTIKTAMTVSPTAFRCIAGGVGIAARRAPTWPAPQP